MPRGRRLQARSQKAKTTNILYFGDITMIYINSNLEKGKTYNSHREMFPKLYYTDFDGKPRQMRHITVELFGGDVYVQTDLTDCGQIQREIERILRTLLAGAKKKASEAQETINTIKKVMGD